MKIGIVCYPTFGGSGVVATELGSFLARLGHKVHFITYNQPVRLDILEENLYYHEVNVQDYPLFQYQPYELALSSKMVDTVLNEGIELLHVHYAIPHAYSAITAREMLKEKGINIPVITTLHGTDITLVGRNPSYKHAVTYSINHSDAVTCVSHDLKKETLKSFVIEKKIKVIPNFIDLRFYKAAKKEKELNLGREEQKIITHISNFRPVKNINHVIDIFYRIHKEIPAKLIMIGDGPEREKAEQQAKELGILQDVTFLGKTYEIERVLWISDLFLLPSNTESFGLAALEAMAAGVPVISTNTGGLPEVNLHGKTGFTANVGDVETMANYGLDLLRNDVLHSEMRKNALARAEEFCIENIISQYINLYESTLQKVKI